MNGGGQPRRKLLLALVVLAGCSSTSIAAPSTLASLVTGTPTTIGVPVTTVAPDIEGYVIDVLNGHTFDLQTPQAVTRLTLGNISVPDIGTCEGAAARSLLASIIFGHKVRVTPNGTVWKDDIDVGMAMVSYGYAKSAGEQYQAADAQSADFSCESTTTTTIKAIVIAPPATKPKPRKPKPTMPVARTTTPAPITEPPTVAEPQDTKPPRTDPAPKTDPPKSDPVQ